MAASFSLVEGQIANRAVFAIAWEPTVTGTRITGKGNLTGWTTSNFGRALTLSTAASCISNLTAKPAGRRGVQLSFVQYVFDHADDRCRAAGETDGSYHLTISVSPNDNASSVYVNGTGGDAVASGWSGILLEGAAEKFYSAGVQLAEAFEAGNCTIDYVIFDNESNQGMMPWAADSAHRQAQVNDPRWATTIKPRLDYLINLATSGAITEFTAATWVNTYAEIGGGSTALQMHWAVMRSYEVERHAYVLSRFIAGVKTVFPSCWGSNYEFHGRKAAEVLADYPNSSLGRGITDLNGNCVFQEEIHGLLSSDYVYNWIGNVGTNSAKTSSAPRSYAYWGGGGDRTAVNLFHVVVYELRRMMAAVASDRTLMAWIMYPGFDDGDLQLGGLGHAGMFDIDPYWSGLSVAAILMSCVPKYDAAAQYEKIPAGVLYFSDIDASVNAPITIWSADKTGKTFVTRDDVTGKGFRPGITQTFDVAGSDANNDTYTVDYENGGIRYIAGHARIAGTGLTLSGNDVTLTTTADLSGLLTTGLTQSRIKFNNAANVVVYYHVTAVNNVTKVLTLLETPVTHASNKAWEIRSEFTLITVAEAITEDQTEGALGNVDMACSVAEQTGCLDPLLTEVNTAIGTVFPRQVLERNIFIGEADADGNEIIPVGNSITWVALRHGSQVTYCIIIGRCGTNKAAWSAQAITGYVGGNSVGTVVTIGATKTYGLYTRTYNANEVLSFSWDQDPPTNLITNTDITNAGVWAHDISGTGSITADAGKPSPIDGSASVNIYRADATVSFAVDEGKIYTASCYVWVGDAINPKPRALYVLQGSNDSVIVSLVVASRPYGDDRWERYYVNFIAPVGETTCKLQLSWEEGVYLSWYCHPQVVQGILPGPIA